MEGVSAGAVAARASVGSPLPGVPAAGPGGGDGEHGGGHREGQQESSPGEEGRTRPRRRRRPLHPLCRQIVDPGQDHGDREAQGQGHEHRLEHPVRELRAVHDGLRDLEHGEGEDPVPDHHPEDVASPQFREQVAECRLPPLRVDRGRTVRRLRPELVLDGLERRQRRRAVAGAFLGRPVEHPLHHVGKLRCARNVELPHRRRLRRPPPLPFRERVLPGEHPIEHHAQREDVRPLVLGGVLPLFRCHVGRRPAAQATPPEGMRHPEVEDLHLPLVRDEDVRGLEVPVDHAFRVRVGEAPGHLRRDVHRLLNRERPFLHPEIQRLPAEQLEYQERAVVAPAHLVEGDEVGVGEAGDGLGLAGDLPLLLGDAAGTDDLHRHLAAEVPILGLVDHAEAASSQFPDDLEAPDDRSGRERNRLGLALLRGCRDLLEEGRQRSGLHARRWTAAIPSAFGHAHPLGGNRGYLIGEWGVIRAYLRNRTFAIRPSLTS